MGAGLQAGWLRGMLFAVGLWIAGCERQADPGARVREFFEQVARGAYAEAYGGAAFAFRAHQDAEHFARTVREVGLAEFAKAQWQPAVVEGRRAAVEGAVQNAAGVRSTLRVELVQEDGRWRVSVVCKPRNVARGPDADLFSSIGRQRGLNPYLYPAAPSEAELRALVGGELAGLQRALNTGSMQEFHAHLAQAWRERATAKGLETAFSSVRDSGFDLAQVEKLVPLYDPAPYVDPEGLLVAAGYYPSAPLRLFFSLKFASEEGRWRLYGLDMQLR